MRLLILALVVPGFLLSLILTALVRRIAIQIGFVDKPGQRKIHDRPKALGGGIAIFLAITIPLTAALLYVRFNDPPRYSFLGSSANALEKHWPGIRQQTKIAANLFLAMAAMHLLGLFDDRKAMGPYSKLVIQLSIITLLVIGADLRALTALDSWGLGPVPSIVVTVLWIGAIANAFNFLDNMDGLSAGVAAVATIAFLITALSIGQWFVAAFLALLLGALLGFLVFNFAPASIFMGDSGSLLIGLVLGVLTVKTTYLPVRDGQTVALGAGWYSLLAPLIVLAVPLYDLLVVSVLRIRRGKSPFVGDTNHLSHRLVARGMSRRTAVLCIYLITAATSAAAILLPHVRNSFQAVLIFIQTLLILGVVMFLEQHPLPPPDTDQ